MKLLVVTPYFYPKIGGMENYAYNISKGLKEKYGWDIVIVTSNHAERKYREDTVRGMKVYRLASWFKISNTPINPLWSYKIKTIVEKEKPDIINGHTPVPFIADIACRLAKKYKIPYILTYQNDLYKSNIFLKTFIKTYYLALGNATIKNSLRIVVTTRVYPEQSEYLRNYLNKIDVIPPGIHLEKFTQSFKNPDIKDVCDTDKIILFVGQLDKTHKHKGVDYLIRAVKQVTEQIPTTKLVIVGKGDNIPEYKQLVRSLSLEQKVIFTGFIPEDDLIRYYHRANVVVLPSTSDAEGFGIVLIEAGACKKPVIGTNAGGIPDVIKHNESGLVVPPKDVMSLSTGIIKIITDHNLAKRFGENGFEYVSKHFTWEKQIQKTHEIFQQL